MDIILCAVLFFASIVTCVITGRSMAWALIVAFLALSCMGLRRGYKVPALYSRAAVPCRKARETRRSAPTPSNVP